MLPRPPPCTSSLCDVAEKRTVSWIRGRLTRATKQRATMPSASRLTAFVTVGIGVMNFFSTQIFVLIKLSAQTVLVRTTEFIPVTSHSNMGSAVTEQT